MLTKRARRLADAIRRIPPTIWGVTALFGLLLVGWSLLAPLGRAPDEPAHADLVSYIARGGAYPDFDGRRTDTAMIAAFVAYVPGLKGMWLTPEAAPPRADRKTFEQWGGDKPTAFNNQMPQHPPLYYWLTGNALRVERAVAPGSEPPLDREWNILRLMNAAMVLPLPLLTWLAARRLGAGATAAITSAIVPLCVPQLLHIGASINNDNLLIVLSAVVAVLIARVLTGDSRRSAALAIGVFAGLALLTKAFGIALLPWIALAYAYQAWQDRERWKNSLVCLVIAGTTTLVVGGWWPARNVLRGNGAFPSVLDPAFASHPSRFDPDLLSWTPHFVSSMIQRFWGDFGYFEAPMTQIVVIAATVIATAAVVLAFLPARLGSRTEARPGPNKGQLAVFGSLFLFLLVLVAYRAYDLYASSGTTPFMQGRYLFGAIVPFAVIVAIGICRVLGRWAPIAVFGAALVMQVDGIRVALRAWWAEPEASLGRKLDAMVRWSPWPAFVTYFVAIAAVVGAVAIVFALVRDARDLGRPVNEKGGTAIGRPSL